MMRRALAVPVLILAVALSLLPGATGARAAGEEETEARRQTQQARERAAAQRMAEVLIQEEEARRKRLAEREAAAAAAHARAAAGWGDSAVAAAPAVQQSGPSADSALDRVFPGGEDAGDWSAGRSGVRGAGESFPREEYPSAFVVDRDAGPAPAPAPAQQAPPRPSAPPTPVAAGEEGLELFHTGYSRFSQGDYARAKAAFEAFLRRVPGHDLSDSAQYWIGECAYAQGDLDGALREYRKVIDSFPFGDKVADALLKTGYVLLEQGKTAEARRVLRQLVEDHPDTGAAQRARQRLGEPGLAPAVQ